MQQSQEAGTPERLAAAATSAALGAFKVMQRAYADARAYYRQATELVPAARSDLVAAYERRGLAGRRSPNVTGFAGQPIVVPPALEGTWGRSYGTIALPFRVRSWLK